MRTYACICMYMRVSVCICELMRTYASPEQVTSQLSPACGDQPAMLQGQKKGSGGRRPKALNIIYVRSDPIRYLADQISRNAMF